MEEKEKKNIKKSNNEKNILILILTIGILIFTLGLSVGAKTKEKEPTIFTKDDIEKIVRFQQLEDQSKSVTKIYAYKDKDGKLMIGFE